MPASKTRRPPLSTPTPVSFGQRGDQVCELQVFLRDLGYPVGEVDGSFGNRTRNAIAIYQETNGMAAHGHWDLATECATGVLVAQDGVVPFTP